MGDESARGPAVPDPPAHLFEGVVPRTTSVEVQPDGTVIRYFDPEPITMADGTRITPPSHLVSFPDGTHVLARRDGSQVVTASDGQTPSVPAEAPPPAVPPPPGAPPVAGPPPAAWAPPHPPTEGSKTSTARLALIAVAVVAAVGGAIVLSGALDDDDVDSEDVDATATPAAPDDDTTTTTTESSAATALEGARLVGRFETDPAAPVNEVTVDVTPAGIVLEAHLQIPDASGCLYFDVDPGEPLLTDETESTVFANDEITMTGGVAGHPCEDGGPDDAGPVTATVRITVQEDIGANGTITLAPTELRFTAQEV